MRRLHTKLLIVLYLDRYLRTRTAWIDTSYPITTSLKFPHIFDDKKNLVQAVVAARSGKGYFGAGYYVDKVNTELQRCHRCRRREDVTHIIRHCPRYESARRTLRDFNKDLDLNAILDTEEGQKALKTFVKTGGAFLAESFFNNTERLTSTADAHSTGRTTDEP